MIRLKNIFFLNKNSKTQTVVAYYKKSGWTERNRRMVTPILIHYYNIYKGENIWLPSAKDNSKKPNQRNSCREVGWGERREFIQFALNITRGQKAVKKVN